jgi:hypothetical protein
MTMTSFLRTISTLSAVCALSACTSRGKDAPPYTVDADSSQAPAMAEPKQAEPQATAPKLDAAPPKAPPLSTLQWKRADALEADLAQALELAPEELCLEFGQVPCIQKVHLVPLGGNEPFWSGMLQPAAEPLASTPSVVDRVVLAACTNRVARDQHAGAGDDAPRVFTQFPLDQPAPAPGSDANSGMVRDLFRRLLVRDPQQSELSAIGALAHDDDDAPVSGVDFAKLACFAIGSSSEFLFF